MDVVLERCAGLDVHQASVVCRVLIGAPGRKPQKLPGRLGTTTRDPKALQAWLAEHGVTHVGMRSTGVYWRPVYAVLEGHFDLTVGNAHHIAPASAAVHTKGSYYRDKYSRLRARRGPVRAIMAIAHKLLLAAFHMLSTGEAFHDLGEGSLDQVARKRSTTKLVQRLTNPAYDVMLAPKAA